MDFEEYIDDVMALANKYGVTDEGQLVSGQVLWCAFWFDDLTFVPEKHGMLFREPASITAM